MIDPGAKCLHDVFDFFHKTVEKNYNYLLCSPNVFKLLPRLVMMHPATIATCEGSFSLSKLIKTNIRSTMTDQIFNNLSILNHFKNKVKRECDLMSVMKEFTGRNERRVSHFGNVIGEK